MRLLPALLIAAVGLFRALTFTLNHDAAWLLFVASRTLDGARLYVDLIEVVPPVVVWLSTPAVLLERLTGVSHTVAFPVMIAVAAAVSAAASISLSVALLAKHHFPAFAAGVSVSLFILPWAHWGQREHIMLIATLPHLISAARRLRGLPGGPSLMLGVPAGIGYSIKPHFALCFLAVELLVLWRTRRLWPIAAVITSVGVGLIVASVLITPEYFTAIWQLKEIYGSFVHRHLIELVRIRPIFVVLGMSLILAVHPGENHSTRQILGAATASWVIIALVQAKGFPYHLLPATAGAVLLLLLTLTELPRGAVLSLAAAVIITIGVGFRGLSDAEAYWWGASQEAQRVMKPGMRVLVLSPRLSHAWPAVNYTGADWSARLPALWPLLSNSEGESLAIAMANEALMKEPVVLIPHFWHEDIRALESDSTFRRMWARYAEKDSLRYFKVYEPR